MQIANSRCGRLLSAKSCRSKGPFVTRRPLHWGRWVWPCHLRHEIGHLERRDCFESQDHQGRNNLAVAPDVTSNSPSGES